jgi:hypothetical protein
MSSSVGIFKNFPTYGKYWKVIRFHGSKPIIIPGQTYVSYLQMALWDIGLSWISESNTFLQRAGVAFRTKTPPFGDAYDLCQAFDHDQNTFATRKLTDHRSDSHWSCTVSFAILALGLLPWHIGIPVTPQNQPISGLEGWKLPLRKT